MKSLSWKTILQNLCEANGELKDLHCHLHYLEFGDVPEDYDNSNNEWLEKREKHILSQKIHCMSVLIMPTII